jgi:hypothetical protein
VRRFAPLLAAGLLACTGIIGCSKPKESCDDYTADADEAKGDDDQPLTATVMLIDVADNSETASGQISAAFEEEIRGAVEDGGWLVARLSGGESQAMLGEGTCFGLGRFYKIDSANKAAREDKQVAATSLLKGSLADLVRATPVAARGSAVRLLDEGHDVVSQLLESGVPADAITVVLYSDLLGVSDDCLNLDGKQALPAVAQQIVDNCFAVQQIAPLPEDVHFVTRAVGNRGQTTTAQETLAGQVESLLCHHMSASCGA